MASTVHRARRPRSRACGASASRVHVIHDRDTGVCVRHAVTTHDGRSASRATARHGGANALGGGEGAIVSIVVAVVVAVGARRVELAPANPAAIAAVHAADLTSCASFAGRAVATRRRSLGPKGEAIVAVAAALTASGRRALARRSCALLPIGARRAGHPVASARGRGGTGADARLRGMLAATAGARGGIADAGAVHATL